MGLATIVSLRMLGLFMIYPILILYVGKIPGATEITMGVAFGAYALMQGILQIPFGMLSDRYGRKRVIIVGLSLFVLGSVIAALADNVWELILGRTIQGAGAVAGAVMALTADLTREETRTKALAFIGMTIGIAVMTGLIIGPILDQLIGLSGIFWLTAGLAVVGILVLIYIVPNPEDSHFHRDTEPVPNQIKRILKDPQLMRFNIGILLLHTIFAACFMAFPLIIRDYFHLGLKQSWWIYVPTLALSVAIMLPMIIIGEKYRRMKQMFIFSIFLIAVVEVGLFASYDNPTLVFFMMIVFFGGFNFLEAALPSLVSKVAPVDSRGTAMGVYSTMQYLGISLGGFLGGIVLTYYKIPGIFVFCAILAGIWLLIAINMAPPRYLRNQLLNIGIVTESEAQKLAMQLTAVQGVAEVVVMAAEGVAYLKVDSHALDEEKLYAFSVSDA